MTPLQFDPISVLVDAAFWQQLAADKLHKYRLDDSEIDVRAHYEPGGGAMPATRLRVGDRYVID